MPESANGVGRHRRPEPFHGCHRRPDEMPDQLWPTRRWPVAGLLLVVAVAAAAFAGTPDPPSNDAMAIDAAQALEVREQEAQSSSRSKPSPPEGGDAQGAAPEQSSKPDKPPKPNKPPEPNKPPKEDKPPENSEPKPEKPSPPTPVGGLSKKQMKHAATIVQVGKEIGLPKRAYVVALATAMQESTLRNLANWNLPASLDRPNDGTGGDHDSVGLFQQRPSTGWGTVKQLMKPTYAARAFYQALGRVSGWQDLPVTVAAQKVQVSAFPDAYAKHTKLARKVVDALD